MPTGDELEPSPDGRELAEIDRQAGALTFFDLAGTQVRKRTVVADTNTRFFRWLPTSTGVMAWNVDASGTPGDLSIVTVEGAVVHTGLQASNMGASSDGRYIAADRLDQNQQPSGVQLYSVSPPLLKDIRMGSGIHLFGWSGELVIYADQSYIYAATVDIAIHRLTDLNTGFAVDVPENGPASSPDGAAVMLRKDHTGYVALVGSSILALPPETVFGSHTVFWLGPHLALGLTSNGQVIGIDVTNGSSSPAQGRINGYVQAVSGQWVAWTDGSTIHLTNLFDGHDINTSQSSIPGRVDALTPQRFILHGTGGIYILDPGGSP
jgi:hypothetical protein